MATAVQQAASAKQQALIGFKRELDVRAPQYAMALPAHIPAERFQRVVLTAVQNNPDLLDCEPQSLWNSAMRCAQDGLLPDGREAALVKFKSQVSYMPMVAGLMKKARNSGEISSIIARDVQNDDEFEYWIDEDGEHLRYKPAIERVDVKNSAEAAQCVRAVFAMCKLKDGTLLVEVMSVAQIERVKSVSRAQSGDTPWSQWWGEMAKKTAIRRLSKRLPMSSDLDDLVRRDDELYNVTDKPAPQVLDMGATTDDNVRTAPPLPPPAQSEQRTHRPTTRAKARKATNTLGSSSQSSAGADEEKAAPDLLREIADALIDCDTHPKCDDVVKLYQREISDLSRKDRDAVEQLVEQRKAAISKANDDSFPGNKKD